jgi:hypothetical protein
MDIIQRLYNLMNFGEKNNLFYDVWLPKKVRIWQFAIGASLRVSASVVTGRVT